MNNETKKNNKTSFIFYGILYAIVIFFILKISSYINAYPRKDIFAVLDILKSELGSNFLNFPGEFDSSTLAAILIISFFVFLIGSVMHLKEKSDVHVKQGTEEGTAKWLTNLEKWNNVYTDPKDEPINTGKKNVIMSKDIYLSMDTRQTRRNLNTLVVGGSGAGKSRFFVKPNLCEMPLNCNFICTDPSGELLAETGSMLEGAGFKIKVFNLVDMSESDQYNPLKYINCENDVILLVDCILANTSDPSKTGGDDFWEKAQKLMFQSLIYFIWLHGDEFHIEKNLNSVVKLMDGCQISEDDSSNDKKDNAGETATYFAALETLGWYFDENNIFHSGKPAEEHKDLYIYHEPLGDNAKNDISLKQWHKFMTGAGKTLKSVLISAMARLSTLDSDAVASLLGDDNIELDKLGDEKTALFVIIPQEHESFNFLAAMLYTQLFQSMYYHAERECQGNYLVIDSYGENVKTFAISHETKINEIIEDEEEFVINFTSNGKFVYEDGAPSDNSNKEENHDEIDEEACQVCDEVAFDHEFIENKDTKMDDSYGDLSDENVKKNAEDFAERAKNVYCTKQGRKFLIKIPSADGNKANDEIVGVYGNGIFAQKRYEAIKAGCKVTRCGLYLPYHVRFMLDEFANIGKIPDFTKKLATCRKYSISASIILQSINQIKTIYKDDWGTIIGNCDSFLFLGCQEMDTLEYVSKLLGKTTQRKRNESVSRGGKGGTNMSYQYSGRELMTADELRRLDNLDCVYVLRGEQPYKGKKHPFDTHPNYSYTADANYKNIYTFYSKPRVKKQFDIETSQASESDINILDETSSKAFTENVKSPHIVDDELRGFKEMAKQQEINEYKNNSNTVIDLNNRNDRTNLEQASEYIYKHIAPLEKLGSSIYDESEPTENSVSSNKEATNDKSSSVAHFN